MFLVGNGNFKPEYTFGGETMGVCSSDFCLGGSG